MPEIGAKKYAGNDPAMKQVWNYIYQLEEQLRYAFNHIGADNIEEGAVTGKHIEAETITADRLSASAGNDLNITGNRAVLLTAKKQSEADGKISQLRVDTDSIAGRVSDAEGNISQIRQTAEGLESRVTSAETSITQNAEQIALRATKTEVTTAVAGVQEGVDANADAIGALQTRTTNAETSITQNAEQIALRATKTEVTTAVAGVQEGVDANADAIGTLQTRTTAAETQIAQNATEISLRATKTELDGLQIGGVNLMLDTKAYGGNGGANYTVSGALQTETYNGFAVRRGENTSDANALQFKLAYAFQPGESYTLSFWAKGSGAAQALITGYTYPCTSVSSEGTAGTDAGGANTFNVTSDWKRYWVTFTMGAWATVPTGKELWLRARNSTSGRVLDVCGLKLERGSRATDWSPAPEDPARSVKTSSVTVNESGIWLDSTGEISLAAGGKINIQSGADEGNQILLGDLFSATDQGGVTGKTANFGSLLVGGNPAAALGGNIVVASAQPSGNGILWLKPNSVATVQYQRATPSTRSWWLEGTRVIESIAAKTTDVLPGGTIHYKLTLPLYALSRLEGVVVAPKLSKSGISGEVALGAQTISILGLNVLTLEGESAINLGAAPGTPITLTLDVTNGDGQKLFVQSDTTIQLEISNRTVAAGGVQALEAYWIP
nr:MAG TPA: Neck appendage protein [Caudoviricetes sp.]